MLKLDKNKFALLIASFILAIGLFYYITGEESVELEKKVYLKISPPSGMTVLGGPRREVIAVLSAPRNMLSLLSSSKLVAHHKINEVAKAGKYSFSLDARDVDLPRGGIKIEQIKPELITVTLDEVVTKKLIVKPYIIGKPSEGYAIDFNALLADPNEAIVKGPKSKLETKKFILTDTIDVVGRIRSFRIAVPLKYSSQYTVESKSSTDVFVPIKQASDQKTFGKVPIRILHSSSSNYIVKIDPAVIDLSIKGPKLALQKLNDKEMLAYINITELGRGEYKLPLMLSLPSDLSLAGDIPVISVSIEEQMKKLNVGPSVNAPVPSITSELTPDLTSKPQNE